MPSKPLLFRIVLGAGLAVVLAMYFNPSRINKVFEMDACLDEGGRWDYQRNLCEEGHD